MGRGREGAGFLAGFLEALGREVGGGPEWRWVPCARDLRLGPATVEAGAEVTLTARVEEPYKPERLYVPPVDGADDLLVTDIRVAGHSLLRGLSHPIPAAAFATKGFGESVPGLPLLNISPIKTGDAFDLVVSNRGSVAREIAAYVTGLVPTRSEEPPVPGRGR